MTIRPATNADAEAVRELVFGILRSYGLQPDPGTADRDLEDLEGNYHCAGGYFAVLREAGGTIVGSYGLARVSDTECELRKMYLAAAHRGKGLGKALLEDALREAGRLGYRVVTLETASVLKEAIALYRKYGFEPYVPRHLATRCDQAYRKVLRGGDAGVTGDPSARPSSPREPGVDQPCPH